MKLSTYISVILLVGLAVNLEEIDFGFTKKASIDKYCVLVSAPTVVSEGKPDYGFIAYTKNYLEVNLKPSNLHKGHNVDRMSPRRGHCIGGLHSC